MKKRNICLIEIIILILGTISFAWIIGGSQELNLNNNFKDVLITIEKNIDLIPSVYAASTVNKCCLNSNTGLTCQQFSSDTCSSSCDGTCAETECSKINECKPGCSIDSVEGLCTPNSMKAQCLSSANCVWKDNNLCQVSECEKGCCTFGLNAQYVTEQRCKRLGQLNGVKSTFDSSKSEVQCIGETMSQQIGACVFGEEIENGKKGCKFGTRTDCISISGEFHEGYLCSNSELKTVCEKQKTTNCLEGREGVYWFDSCGNAENIYSSDKIKSWNNGKVASASSVCSSPSATCGNCDYLSGTICGTYRAGKDTQLHDGDYTCRNLNCKSAPAINGGKKDRINGESWCVYDGPIGGGSLLGGKLGSSTGSIVDNWAGNNNASTTSQSGGLSGLFGGSGISGMLSGIMGGGIGVISMDTVGSRHFRYICENGVVKSEPCADYRAEICVENEKALSNGKKITDAMCRVNMGEQCIGLNSGQNGDCSGQCMAQCTQNPDCRLHPVFVDTGFKFLMCVPKYPLGFELGKGGITGLAGLTSGFGSQFGNLGGLSQLSGLGGGSSALSSLTGSSGESSASDICGAATKTCKVTWKKVGIPPMCTWKCINNCQCHEATFSLQMTALCVSLGDCGPKANYVGKMGLGGASVSKKGKHGKAPPNPIMFGPIFSMLAITMKAAAPSGGTYKQVEDILNLPFDALSGGNGGGGGGSMGGGGGIGMGGYAAGGIGGAAFGAFAGAGSASAYTMGVVGYGIPVSEVSGMLGGAAGASTGLFGGSNIGMWILRNPTYAGIIVGLAIIGLSMLMKCGKVETVEIKYECKPWVRPVGGGTGALTNLIKQSDAVVGKMALASMGCAACTADPLKPCTKYRCESLGARCKMMNEGTGFDECVTSDVVVGVPIITPWEEILNKSFFSYTSVSNNGFGVRGANGECIEAFTPIVFGVKTDVPAKCKWGMDKNETDTDFLEGDIFAKNHTLISSLPSVESLIASETSTTGEFNELSNSNVNGQTLYNYLLDVVGDLNIYVKCSNIDEKTNEQDYKINFCVKPGPDKTPPVVIATSPPENWIVAFNAVEQFGMFFVNEPVECKWDKINPTSTDLKVAYNSLANTMSCANDVNDGTLLGYPCNATLPISGIENKYYIICRDQPWLGENDSRNIGNVYEYKLLKSSSELKIDSISPSGDIIKGGEPVSVELTATTSGGVNGITNCQWKLDNSSYNIDFFETGSTTHVQQLTSLMKGNHSVIVNCTDSAGNNAEKIGSFNLLLDKQIPSITRIYYDSGKLTILTDEDAQCAFSKNDSNCNFMIENSSQMQSGFEKVHTAPWELKNIFNVKCQDIWGNKPAGCSMNIEPSTIKKLEGN
ncbi:MAG: hypothetical protein WC781_04270 [Candidatus Pacearchaeota archaeon]|jgi:hypothetical protein